MNICIVTPTFPPRKFGGITDFSYNLSRYLLLSGAKVKVITTNLGNEKNEPIKNSNRICEIDVQYLRNVCHPCAFCLKIILPIFNPIQIIKMVDKCDVVHINDYRNGLSIITYIACKITSKPYVIQTHGSMTTSMGKKLLKKIFDKMIGASILKNAKICVALSSQEKDQYQRYGIAEKNIWKIPNGINIHKNIIKKNQLRELLSISPDEKIIMFLGRINVIKGLDTLIVAFNRLISAGVKCHLILIGPDEGYLKEIQKLINKENYNKIHRINFVGPENKGQYLSEADIVVYPSKYEIFGIVPIEASSMGKKVIISDACGCYEWVSDIRLISVFRNGDPDDLYDKILQSLSDVKINYDQEGNKVMKRFSWESIGKEYLTLYHEVVGK